MQGIQEIHGTKATASPRPTRAQRRHAVTVRIRDTLEQLDRSQCASLASAPAVSRESEWPRSRARRCIATGQPELDTALGGGLLRGALHEFVGLRSPEAGLSARSSCGSASARMRGFGWMPPMACLLSMASAALEAFIANEQDHGAIATVAWIGGKVHPSMECMMAVPHIDSQGSLAASSRRALGSGSVDRDGMSRDAVDPNACDVAAGDIAGEVAGDVAARDVDARDVDARDASCCSLPLQRGRMLLERSVFIYDQDGGGASSHPSARGRGRASASRRSSRGLSAASLRAWCAEQAILVGGVDIIVLDANGLDANEWRRLQLAASSSPRAPIVLAATAPCDGERWDSGRFHPTATRWSVEPTIPLQWPRAGVGSAAANVCGHTAHAAIDQGIGWQSTKPFAVSEHHLDRVTITATQKFNALHPIIRVNATELFVYRLRNMKDLETFIDEVSAVVDKK
ncbi:MAG: hypothetical protein ACKOYN_12150, partial [Planctomycetota bacterium]